MAVCAGAFAQGGLMTGRRNRRRHTAIGDLEPELLTRLEALVGATPWVLRITEHKGRPAPVLVVRERVSLEERQHDRAEKPKSALKDRGLLYGQPLRRCLPVIRLIVSRVCDGAGIPLELERLISQQRISFRGNLPLDEEAGTKLSLIFKLQERVNDMDRVELIAWRVERFTREEAAYWLSRMTQYGLEANRWARAGMRVMLGGQPGDKAVCEMLSKLRK